MGAGNVKAVYHHWGKLPHAPFRMLAFMALTSLDESKDGRPGRQFYGGREMLAVAMGRVVPPENPEDPGVTRERHAAFAAVDRALKVLSTEGAIRLLEAAGHYRPAKYELVFPTGSTTVSVDLEHHGERGAKDHGERERSTTVSVTKHHGERGAQEQQEEPGLTSGETGRGDLPPTGGAHARDDTRQALRTVPTEGVRDLRPAGGGVPGQRAMLLPVAGTSPSTTGEAPPNGRCDGCSRPLPRPGRKSCQGCINNRSAGSAELLERKRS